MSCYIGCRSNIPYQFRQLFYNIVTLIHSLLYRVPVDSKINTPTTSGMSGFLFNHSIFSIKPWMPLYVITTPKAVKSEKSKGKRLVLCCFSFRSIETKLEYRLLFLFDFINTI